MQRSSLWDKRSSSVLSREQCGLLYPGFQATRHNIIAYLLKVRTEEPEKQPLLGNGCITHNNEVTVGRSVFCEVRAKAI
jgi:hypothetical protein